MSYDARGMSDPDLLAVREADFLTEEEAREDDTVDDLERDLGKIAREKLKELGIVKEP